MDKFLLMGSHILIVEDERHLADGIRFNLEAEGYKAEIAADGESALEILLRTKRETFDAVILDVMLPGIDGFEVARELRRAAQFIPILMLTARARPEDVLRGFEAGADDYLPKPFELKILIARLNGLLRRREWLNHDRAMQSAAASSTSREQPVDSSHAARTLFIFDDKEFDFDALELHVRGRTIRLTLMESELLRYLIEHANRPVSRKAMLEEVWNLHEDTDTRAIDNFIVRLRKYIEEKPSKPKYLLTVRGVGYRFVHEIPK
ncbi:MAG: response regulator transcription factor [Pyrinomonadaceae bacterium]